MADKRLQKLQEEIRASISRFLASGSPKYECGSFVVSICAEQKGGNPDEIHSFLVGDGERVSPKQSYEIAIDALIRDGVDRGFFEPRILFRLPGAEA